jgi:ABC-type transporter Mla MlaB component
MVFENPEIDFDGYYTLTVKGSYTFSSIGKALEIWSQIKKLLINKPKVVISCADLDVVDSSFIAFLLEVKRYLIEQEIRLQVSQLSSCKRDFFKAYGLCEVLDL